MGHVDAVRAKHQLEAGVRELLRLAAMASNEELELAIAHIADDLRSPGGSSEDKCRKFKGLLLTMYWEGRRNGTWQQRKLLRPLMQGKKSEYFRRRGLLLHERMVDEHREKVLSQKIAFQEAQSAYASRYNQWKEECRSIPFWRRPFGPPAPPKPTKPARIPRPPLSGDVVQREIYRGTMHEFVIASLREFQFSAEIIPDEDAGFSFRELKALINE